MCLCTVPYDGLESINLRLYFHLVPNVAGTGSRFTTTLTRIQWLLQKMDVTMDFCQKMAQPLVKLVSVGKLSSGTM